MCLSRRVTPAGGRRGFGCRRGFDERLARLGATSAARLAQCDGFARHDLVAIDEPLGRFDHRVGTQRAGHAPRLDAAARLRDRPVLLHEDQVDRDAHRERVDRAARRDDQRVVGWDGLAAQQALLPRFRIERGFDFAREHGAALGVDQFALADALPNQRREKRRLAHSALYGGWVAPPSLGVWTSGETLSFTSAPSRGAGVRNSLKSTTQPCVPRKFRKRL